MLRGKQFQLRRYGQKIVQHLFRPAASLGNTFGQRIQLRLQGIQPVVQLTAAFQRQHRHGAIGFNLQQALHQPTDTPLAGAGPHEDRKSHPARGIHPEIGDDQRRLIHGP